jgi:quercetin dioxygenase-like cupin family protein
MSGSDNDPVEYVVTEEDLDEALRETFPASDPAALTPHLRRPRSERPIEAGYSLSGHHQDGSRNLDAPVVRLELRKELADLWRSQPVQATGHSAKTLVKHPDLRVVLIAMNAGARLGDHQSPGRVELQILEGRVRLWVRGEIHELPAGGWVALGPEVPYDVEASEASAVLLSISWPTEH